MKVLLLSGYRPHSESGHALGTEMNAQGVTLLDRRIEQLRELGLNIVVIVSGSSADKQLRLCRRISEVELVFDANDALSTLATNFKAGLKAAPGEAFFTLPVDIPAPPVEVWSLLRDAWRALPGESDVSMLQVITAQGAPWHFGFPLLCTRSGNELLTQIADFQSFLDVRLKYQHVVLHCESDLAPTQKPF